ncbi:hypothetical protein ACFC08_17610 [Streptomyces sp. NPDC056112]|uniref:hypothetical protein n=1 Tax=Streptomyces sp. NPDC056112 TaxID=3345715 RepID=UPI0035E2A788
MTISYVGSGATASGASSVTVAYPSAPSAGQLGVLQVVSGHATEAVPSTPSGWTLAGTLSGGGGTFGAGTGPRRLTWFVRVMRGGDTQPTTAIPSGSSGSVIAGTITLLARSAGTGWRWASSLGDRTTSSTAFTATGQSPLTFKAGDFCWLGYALPASGTTFTAQGATATGVTFGTVTANRVTSAVATGNAARTAAGSVAVSSGAASIAPTITATLSVAGTGVAGMLRIREASSDVNAAPQSVFPPRNLVSVTGLAGDDITSVTVYRQAGTALTPVRAAAGVDTTGANVLLRVDAEQPFGVAHNYAVDLTDVNGSTWRAYSGPITSTVDGDVISDAVRGVGAKVFIEEWPEKRRSREATTFNVGGRLVVVGKPRSAAQSTITVSTDTSEDGDNLQDILDHATEGILLIRKQISLEGVDGYQALIEDSERRQWTIAYRLWELSTAETEPWPDVLEASGFTLQDVANNVSTLSDLAAQFATLLAVALYDFG